MLRLTDETRRKWLICAAAICAVPTVLAPLAGRSAYQGEPSQAALDDSFKVLPVASAHPPARVVIHRDPFIADTPANANGAHSTPRGISRTAGICPTPIVRGIAIGTRPQAILACGPRIDLVAAGDRVGGAIVSGITSNGVVLSSGVVLRLDENNQ